MAKKIFTKRQLSILLDTTFCNISTLQETKGAEYSRGGYDKDGSDILDNFRRNGEELNLPMEVILRVYAAKHYAAITQYIVDLHAGVVRDVSEPIDGRVDDLINYLLLFKCMLEERRQESLDAAQSEEEVKKLLS